MKTTKKNKEFINACTPLMEYIAKNHNQHCTVIVTLNESKLVQGVTFYTTNKFIKD